MRALVQSSHPFTSQPVWISPCGDDETILHLSIAIHQVPLPLASVTRVPLAHATLPFANAPSAGRLEQPGISHFSKVVSG